ncbi:MAG: hypothetical protein JF571_03470 [Asticcacaulis sp.]|nr:hypothetical protein [Asticcacaulis sp.]MBW8880773.1 hypothetical protein [Asticcacaulis sp.]
MARKGAEQLINAENAVELALCEVTALTSTLGRMRLDSNLSMVIGQEAMGALVESITMLSNARGAMVKAHGALDGVKTQIGCGAVSLGDTGKDDTKKVPAPSGFHVVGDDRNAA